ncbi:hypothetical protein IRP63_14080 (plasmid) [Clostridium botulinum]|uniref:Uncharacterized protein n=2 Tax=Clostridium botulinum TaxID=1491 RepID=A0A0A0HYL4_CLOBO|nr:hypothetical protein [Clostridium botulinum]KGM93523.1 hypothetical protein Z955_14775 [Clostridium botulinum C/D str. DC5]KOC56877.1 hypothetical protein ADU89_01390 [Clostridium botulinum]KOC57352.1 hypothetical protein ADU90_05930 [Clostridium botulinum]MCD3232585.1 hypothetical protein [Clostridium botulinum D/C]MCD3238486.1 hypothetical protein [Clostridium botulinum D/C]
MIGLNYLDNFKWKIKCKLARELNYRGESKYNKKETWYNLRYGVYKYYIYNVKGNENCTYKEVMKKLSSNALSGVKMPDDREGVEVYRYGNMAIKVKNNEIVYICNNKGIGSFERYKFNVDTKYRDYLRKLWRIDDL